MPRLIEPGVFDAVQASLKRYVTFVPRNQQRFYLLKGLLFCECGRRMHGTAWHENRYYCCEGKKTKECRWPSQKADPLELIVSLQAVYALKHPDAVLALARDQRGAMSGRDEAMMRLDAINEQLARLPEFRSRLIDARTEGTISKFEFNEKAAGLDDRRRRLEDKRESLQSFASERQVDEFTAARFAEQLAKHGDNLPALPKASPEDWVEILRTVMRKVVIGHDGTMMFEAVVPFEPMVPARAADGASNISSPVPGFG